MAKSTIWESGKFPITGIFVVFRCSRCGRRRGVVDAAQDESGAHGLCLPDLRPDLQGKGQDEAAHEVQAHEARPLSVPDVRAHICQPRV